VRIVVDVSEPDQAARVLDRIARLGATARVTPDGSSDLVTVRRAAGGERVLIPRASVLYGQALGDYVRIVSDRGRYLVRGRISDMESRWGRFGFVRTHRAFVINGGRVLEIRRAGNGTARISLGDGEEIPVSRRLLPRVRAALGA
jgi:DNA-binding LytR/AlgR family response regulator